MEWKKKLKRVFSAKNIVASFLIAILVGLLFTRLGFGAGGYLWIIEVNIDNTKVPGALSNFPVYVSGTVAELATTANGGEIENTDATGGITGSLTVPADFTVGSDTTCDTEYSFEFEDYDATDGSFDLHVKIPSVSDSEDTTFYFCFSDSSVTTSNENIADVWSNDFVSVWHFAEASGTFYDSVGNHNATDSVSATGKTGKVGPGQEFDGTDNAQPGAHADFRDTTVTVSLWEWADSSGDSNDVLFDNSTSSPGGGEGGYMHKKGGRLTARKIGESGVTSRVSSITTETWEYVSMVIDLSTGTQTIYLDGGAETDTDAIDTFTPSSNTVRIGARNDAIWFDPFTGYIDEVRFSSVLRSADWIEASYNNQNDPSTFAVLEDAELGDAPPAIVIGESAITVPSALEDALETALGNYRPDEDMELEYDEYANMWVVTSYGESDETDYYWVSVAGLLVEDPEDLDGWDLGESVWNGTAIAEDNGDTTYTAHVDGSVGYENMLATAGLSDIASPDTGGTGSATYYFPFPPGYVALFGTKGIHTDVGPVGTGYGGRGWVAVDWVGGPTYADNIFPNSVYVSQSGVVSYVCRDSVQTWVQIGNFLYGHLNDNETLREGTYHSQGSYLGSLITDSHSTRCGYTSQRPTSYHLHIGFKPNGDYFQWEDWILTLSDETFRRGGAEISPGEYMLAEWAPRPIVPTPGPTITPGGPTPTPGSYYGPPPDEGGSGSIWNGFINGIKTVVQARVDYLNDPDYTAPDLPEGVTFPAMMLSGARIAIRSIHVLLTSSLNLTMSIFVFFMVAIMEPIRFIRGLWIGIKEMIPFL